MTARWIFGLVLLLLVGKVQAKEWIYVVTKGDNLWQISQTYLKSVDYYSKIQHINNISRPKNIPPGTRLRVPLDWVKQFSANVTVKNTKGKVTKINKHGSMSVNLNTEFSLGDELQLTPKAIITLVFADKTEMTILGPSKVQFDHLSHYGKTGMVDTRLKLDSGKLEIRAEKSKGSGSRLDIKTASAVTSVRGTVFRTSVNSDNATSSVEVLEGKVAVAAENKTVEVPSGYGVQVKEGEDLGLPEKLLAPPEFIDIPTEINSNKTQINWSAIKNASRYQILVSTDSLMSELISSAETNDLSFKIDQLPEGDIFVRLSAISDSGLIGLGKTATIWVNQFPRPPLLNSIPELIQFSSTPLTWQPAETEKTSQKYLVQLSKNDDFNTILEQTLTQLPRYSPSNNLAFGRYYWRVATILSNTKERGAFPQPEQFQFKALLEVPKLSTQVNGSQLVVKWAKLKPKLQLELELADNKGFKNSNKWRLSNKQLLSPFVAPLKVAPNQYLRARTIFEAHSQVGEWSKLCILKPRLAFSACKL